MKSIGKIFLMICAIFIITSCKKEEETPLVEINISELVTLFDSDNKFIFFIKNDNNSNSKSLQNEIEKYQKLSNNIVYYIDTTNITDIEAEIFNIITLEDATKPKVYMLDNGEITLNEDDSITYQELKNEIGNEKLSPIDMTEFNKNRKSQYQNGLDNLEKGLIGTSYMHIYNAKPYEQAIELLKNENNYNLLNSWIYENESGNNCEYYNLVFVKGDDSYYETSYNGKCSNLDKNKLTSTKYTYYLDGNKVMAMQETDKEYKTKYIIEDLNSTSLNITFNNKTYNFKINT